MLHAWILFLSRKEDTEEKSLQVYSVNRACTQPEEAREGLKAMASRPRGRTRKNNNTAGNARIDAALDAMRPFGFDDELVRQTVNELLDVYEGSQGWPFIEEAYYRLLIETILGKQQISSEEKKEFLQDNARREGEPETSAATLTTAISEAGSSNLVARDSLLVAQTNDVEASASLAGRNSIQSTEREGRTGKVIRVEPENEREPVDDAIGSNNRDVGAKHVESTTVRRLSTIQSSQPRENLPTHKRKPCYGWIDSDDDDKDDLIYLPQPPLPEELLELLQQTATPQRGTGRRRKSRWDEKPDGMA